ncbi:MAG: OsmC family protein [Ekhidna sp.]
MNYRVTAESFAGNDATISIKESNINFGTTVSTSETLPSPAELFLGSFSACILKNVERFSEMLKFEYQKATIKVEATRLETPPRMEDIEYILEIHSTDDNLNVELLKKNIEKYGTIFNTVNSACRISGQIIKV